MAVKGSCISDFVKNIGILTMGLVLKILVIIVLEHQFLRQSGLHGVYELVKILIDGLFNG